jgi:hypothetical protein
LPDPGLSLLAEPTDETAKLVGENYQIQAPVTLRHFQSGIRKATPPFV